MTTRPTCATPGCRNQTRAKCSAAYCQSCQARRNMGGKAHEQIAAARPLLRDWDDWCRSRPLATKRVRWWR